MADTLNDLIHTKLAARYPTLGVNASNNDLLAKFAVDNPTFKNPDGTLAFYSATGSESLADAAYRYWGAFVP